MAFQPKWRRNLCCVNSIVFAGLFLLSPQVLAQAPADGQAQTEADADPFAVPVGANAQELMKFIASVRQKRGNTMESVTRAATAAVAGAEAIRKLKDVPEAIQMAAIKEEIGALNFLSRYNPAMKAKMDKLMKELENSTNPVLARLGKMEEIGRAHV